jgi:hypothetical protein
MYICHRMRRLDAGAERVFEYLADVHNLPEYFDQLTQGGPARKSWFWVDHATRRVCWGSQTSPYSGAVTLRTNRAGTVVDIEVHTDDAALDEYYRRLDEALDHIADEVQAA